jgi:tRNA(fMet)-specific endonuclease VapC
MRVYMLDTNIVSDMMRNPQGHAALRAMALSQATPDALLQISVIVDCELLFGLARKPNPRLSAAYERTTSQLTVSGLEPAVAPVYASLRAAMASVGIGLDANDALIAAHALALDATLVSADAAFARVPGLQLENWLE